MTLKRHKVVRWRACPFCGELPRYGTRADEALTSHNIVDWHYIDCANCDIQMRGTDLDTLLESWNTRRRPVKGLTST